MDVNIVAKVGGTRAKLPFLPPKLITLQVSWISSGHFIKYLSLLAIKEITDFAIYD